MIEVKTFKTVDDIIEYYRGGGYAKEKEAKKSADNTEDTLSGASEDSEATRDAG